MLVMGFKPIIKTDQLFILYLANATFLQHNTFKAKKLIALKSSNYEC
jgi:hypothetical protein